MLLHDLRKGMTIHHTLRTRIGAGNIVVPIKAQVGGVNRLWEEDEVIITLREGRETRLISGKTEEIKKELENWHEGTGFDCVVCLLAIEKRLAKDAVTQEEMIRSTEEAGSPDNSDQLLEISVGNT